MKTLICNAAPGRKTVRFFGDKSFKIKHRVLTYPASIVKKDKTYPIHSMEQLKRAEYVLEQTNKLYQQISFFVQMRIQKDRKKFFN